MGAQLRKNYLLTTTKLLILKLGREKIMEMFKLNCSFSAGITRSLRLASLSALKRARFRRNITSSLEMEKKSSQEAETLENY